MKFLNVKNLPKSLPPTPYDEKDSPIWYEAYERCIAGEARVAQSDESRARFIHLCGHLIVEAPSDDGRTYMCNLILNMCKQDDALALLGMRLFHFVLQRMIRINKADNDWGYVILPGLLISKEQNPTLYSEVTKRSALYCEISKAFERDEYRYRMLGLRPEEMGEYIETSYLEIVRLIPPYSNVTLLDTSELEIIKDNWTGTEGEEQELKLLEFIKGYGGFEMEPLIPPANDTAHTPLSNALAIAQFEILPTFGAMIIWLEPVSIQQDSQTYHVYGRNDFGCPSLNMRAVDYVTEIRSKDTERAYELPDPRYIALHAAFSRTLHKSGMWSDKGQVGPQASVLYDSLAAVAGERRNV
ncbi:hypothetical protein CVT24_006576 [Panaeolus cyanescens]|uniref:HNH nuclease domain-containing protein n=1 Tax=Panaeolus cyanescens TaxID=181874 RepID=A0A409X1A2_9AGAR|nr:hypothetical protein CVT24_006576 [Panaeolus cyanescens]